MTTDRDFDGIAKTWLADGPVELSDRVLVADTRHLGHIVEDRRVERQVAHRLVEVDQAAGRVETHRRKRGLSLHLDAA